MFKSRINFDSNVFSDDFNWKLAFGSENNRFNQSTTFIFRLLNSILFLLTLGYTLFKYIQRDCSTLFWFMYATNWTQIIVTIYAITGTIITIKLGNTKTTTTSDLTTTRIRRTPIPWWVKVHWNLQDSALVMSAIVTLLSWYGCISLNEGAKECYIERAPYTLIVHGYNFVYMIIDIYNTKQPFTVLHGFYPIIISTIYFIWTYIHYRLEIGTCDAPNSTAPLYGAFTWSDDNGESRISIFILIICISIPLLNIFYWFLYYTRLNPDVTKTFRNHFPSTILRRIITIE